MFVFSATVPAAFEKVTGLPVPTEPAVRARRLAERVTEEGGALVALAGEQLRRLEV